VELVEAAAASLRGEIAAFKAAEVEGFKNEGVIDEGFDVRALREAARKFGISVQRYWNGADNLATPGPWTCTLGCLWSKPM
jgi:hypothetical protein